MRSNNMPSRIALFHILIWMLAIACSSLAQLEEPVEAAEQIIQSANPKRTSSLVRPLKSVKKAPAKIGLGADDFLRSGLKRKSVAGVYGTTAAVSLGGAAIWYQTMNLKSKNRDAATKAEKDKRIKAAICEAQRRHAAEGGQASFLPTSPLEAQNVPPLPLLSAISGAEADDDVYDHTQKNGNAHPYPPSRAISKLTKRISDAALNTIEDYNKMIAASEGMVSGSIAVTAA
uniref:Transmembrane protein n=2 Tax=Kalmanozyma brasiliensis (strain GHG001) TaxID=1365824 RepID=V5EWZ5_KALBG